MAAPEVSFRRSSSWWGTTSLESSAASPLSERLRLYVGPLTDDPPYPRHVRTTDRGFDAVHFAYCDVPALMPFLIGPTTRKLLVTATAHEEPFTLEVRENVVRVWGVGPEERHLAVHRALAEDYTAHLTAWQERVLAANGQADAVWPLAGTLISRAGTLHLSLSWTVPLNDRDAWHVGEEGLRTHVRGDHEGKTPWSIRSSEASELSARMLAGRSFVISGTPTVALEHLPPLIAAANVVSITGGKRLSVTFCGLPTVERITAAVRILELCHDASSSPYR